VLLLVFMIPPWTAADYRTLRNFGLSLLEASEIWGQTPNSALRIRSLSPDLPRSYAFQPHSRPAIYRVDQMLDIGHLVVDLCRDANMKAISPGVHLNLNVVLK